MHGTLPYQQRVVVSHGGITSCDVCHNTSCLVHTSMHCLGKLRKQKRENVGESREKLRCCGGRNALAVTSTALVTNGPVQWHRGAEQK